MGEGALVKNAADAKQVDKAGKVEKRSRQEELEDIYNVMQTPAGRRLIWRIINKMGHYDSPQMADNSGSWTYFNLGMRAVARQLKADVYEIALPEYQLMEQEHVKEQFEERARRQGANKGAKSGKA